MSSDTTKIEDIFNIGYNRVLTKDDSWYTEQANYLADKVVSSISPVLISGGGLASNLKVAGTITLNASGYIRGGQTSFKNGDGFFEGYDTNPELEVWCYPDLNLADYAWADGTKSKIGIRFMLHLGTNYIKKVVVKLKLASSGTSNSISCDIYNSDDNFLPTGNSLGSATISGISNTSYEEKEFVFDTPISVVDENHYVAVFSCSSVTPAIHLYHSSFYSDRGFRIDYYSSSWHYEEYYKVPWIKIYSYNDGYKISIGNDSYNFSYNASNLRTSSMMLVYDTGIVFADRYVSYGSGSIKFYNVGQETLRIDALSNGILWSEPCTTIDNRWNIGGIRPYHTGSPGDAGLEIYGYYDGGIRIYGSSNNSWKVMPTPYTFVTFGSSSTKITAFYSNNFNACPLPTVENALDSLELINEPKTKEKLKNPDQAHFENDAKSGKKRKYFDTDDLPDDCKSINDLGEPDIELTRTIGFILQAVRELNKKVKNLEKMLK